MNLDAMAEATPAPDDESTAPEFVAVLPTDVRVPPDDAKSITTAYERRHFSGGEPAITVDHVAKRFRLYHERNDSLKATVMAGSPPLKCRRS